MRLLIAAACFLLAGAPRAHGQERRPEDAAPAGQLPRAAVREVVRLYDGPHARRAYDRTLVGADQIVDGNLSVIDGPLLVEGRVTGRILAINSDVLLRPGARIDGDILVVGGDIEGVEQADVAGEVRVYRQRLAFTRDGDRIAVTAEADQRTDDDSWWRRLERRRSPDSRSRLVIASAGPYNRVEGLPVNVGPSLRFQGQTTRVRADAFIVLRTGASFRSDSSDIGYDLGIEASHRTGSGARIGARAFSTIDAVESWQLSPLEYGLSSLLFRRDYLDLYERRGGKGFLSLFDNELGEITLTYSHERWSPRSNVDPWSLFRQGAEWRENPLMDEGRLHLLAGSVRFDTRNDDERPWAGWFVQTDIERGAGDLEVLGATPPGVRTAVPGHVAYMRAFVDARRYNRVGPAAQLNFRLVTGGWLAGDPLPLQRRLSVSGAGALPGFDFRTPLDMPTDVGTCTVDGIVSGRPALCDRVVLAQVEYRGDLHFDLFGGFDWRASDMHFENDPVWVVFADAGRGWLVGDASTPLHFGTGQVPPLSSFRTDIGAGLDFGVFGVFAAKAISDGNEPLNFLVRLRHRF